MRNLVKYKNYPFMFIMAFLSWIPMKGQLQQLCGTASPSVSILDTIPAGRLAAAYTNARFNVVIHIVQNDDGTGSSAISAATAISAFSNMQNGFSPFNICFNLKNILFIYNSSFYSFDMSKFSALVGTQFSTDAIDIYMVPNISGSILGATDNVPGRGIVIGYDGLTNGSSLIHEIGHALGLFHTFEKNTTCAEAINGSNCATCGDQVCDTPADPFNGTQLGGFNPSNCTYDGTGGFSPLTNNYMMQKTQSDCRSQFTSGQINRIFQIIPNSSVLLARIPPVNVTISNTTFPFIPSLLSYKFTAKNSLSAYNVTLGNTTQVGFIAENSIQLANQFIVPQGARFEAKIGSSCPGAFSFRPANNSTDNVTIEDQNIGIATAGINKGNNGIEQEPMGSNNFKLMPNPGNGLYAFNIDTDFLLEVRNTQGSLLKLEPMNKGSGPIDISEFSSGLYFFTIKTNNYTKTLKVIKE